MSTKPRIGILALQGDFDSHANALAKYDFTTSFIKKSSDFSLVDGIIIPGGESSTLLKLLERKLQESLCEKINRGFPTFVTCAGLILLAKKVTDPSQFSLGLINCTVQRNAYGRQCDSFITDSLENISSVHLTQENESTEGIFIRAPKITVCDNSCETILAYNSSPVLIKENNCLAATFHPELCESKHLAYRIFKEMF